MVSEYPVVFFSISTVFSRLPLEEFDILYTNRPKWVLLPRLIKAKS